MILFIGLYTELSMQAITTQDGKLVITMTEMKNHDLNFQSGMWLCSSFAIAENAHRIQRHAEFME